MAWLCCCIGGAESPSFRCSMDAERVLCCGAPLFDGRRIARVGALGELPRHLCSTLAMQTKSVGLGCTRPTRPPPVTASKSLLSMSSSPPPSFDTVIPWLATLALEPPERRCRYPHRRQSKRQRRNCRPRLDQPLFAPMAHCVTLEASSPLRSARNKPRCCSRTPWSSSSNSVHQTGQRHHLL